MPEADGFDALFSDIRGSRRPGSAQAVNAITSLLDGRACRHRISEALQRHSSPQLGWPMAYALSWISVAGGDSVMPPWVRKQFKEASWIVRDLRDQACVDSGCHWCRERNDPKRALSRWFGFDGFRPEPRDAAGRPLLIARCIGCWSRNFLQLFAFYVLSVAQLLGGCIKLTNHDSVNFSCPKQAQAGPTGLDTVNFLSTCRVRNPVEINHQVDRGLHKVDKNDPKTPFLLTLRHIDSLLSQSNGAGSHSKTL
jgi:hypothetical protein